MQVSELIAQSAVIMVIGLIVVFAFLSIMIMVVSLSHRIIHALGLDKEPETGEVLVKDKRIIAIIGAALARFRAGQK